jgi:hypothetical protein
MRILSGFNFSLNWYYSLYRLYIQVNCLIPGPVPLEAIPERAVDVCVRLGDFPNWITELLMGQRVKYYSSDWLNEAGQPYMSADRIGEGDYFHLQYDDGIEFVCDHAATKVWGTWPNNLGLSDAALYLLGPIMGFLLRLRGITCLHASCIAVGERALALVGSSGAGKSTTAAALTAMGYLCLSDDVLPLLEEQQAVYAIPGYPRLRLWSDAVEALYGKPDAQPLLTPNWEKRYLDLSQEGFRTDPLPLEAIYCLDWESQGGCELAIAPYAPQEGFVTLVANTYRNELLDKNMRRQEFQFLSRLVQHIPLRRITSYREISKLADLCDAIVQDFQLLKPCTLLPPTAT